MTPDGAASDPGSDGPDADGTAATAADWGVAESGGWFSRETKIGIALVVLLLCTFSYVVYMKVDQRRRDAELLAKAPKPPAPRAARDDALEPSDTVTDVEPPPARTLPPPPAHEPPPFGQDEPSSDPFAHTATVTTSHSGAFQTASNVVPSQGEPSGFGSEPSTTTSAGQATLEPEADPFAGGQTIPWEESPATEPPTPAASTTVAEVPPQEDPFDPSVFQPTPAAEADPFAAAAGQSPTAGAATLPANAEPSTGSPMPQEFFPAADVAGSGTSGATEEPNPLPNPATINTTGDWGVASDDAAAGAATVVIAPAATAHGEPGGERPVQCAGQAPFDPAAVGHAPAATADADPFAGDLAVESPSASEPFDPATPTPTVDPGSDSFGGVMPQSNDRPTVYEVRPRDTFWSISRSQYGTAGYYVALARYNADRIPDASRMRPGMKVLVPAREVLEARFPDVCPRRSAARSSDAAATSGFFIAASGEPMYRVGARDTLAEIAQRHLGRSSRWTQIYEMNRETLSSPHDLTIGTALKLPADASRVQTAANPAGTW